MSKPYLEITYRQGKPFAAYLYLDRRAGDKVTRTVRHESWLLDFTADGRAIGVEFTHVSPVDLTVLNQVLASAHQPELSAEELKPWMEAA